MNLSEKLILEVRDLLTSHFPDAAVNFFLNEESEIRLNLVGDYIYSHEFSAWIFTEVEIEEEFINQLKVLVKRHKVNPHHQVVLTRDMLIKNSSLIDTLQLLPDH